MSGTRARHTSETARQAKAWCTFNGGQNSIAGSFNVSSITDASSTAGQYTVSFDNNMENANYVVVSAAAGTTDGRIATVWSNTKTVGSVNVYGLPSYGTIAYIDINVMDIAIFN